MLFNSLEFLFFLSLVLAAYWVLNLVRLRDRLRLFAKRMYGVCAWVMSLNFG
jgi:hypothetical protein